MFDDPAWTRPLVETCVAEKLAHAESGAARSSPGFPSIEEFAPLLAAYADWARA